MKDIQINLNTIEKVKKFVGEITKTPCDCDIVSESSRYIIDAKSIMGIFSLDLSKTLTLKIHTEDPTMIAAVEENIAEFKV